MSDEEAAPRARRYGRRWGMSILPAAGLALGLAGAAWADGVVIASTSDSIRVGDRIEVGRALELAEGEEVQVLDRSGAVRRIRGPGGRYGAPRSSSSSSGSTTAAPSPVARLAVSFTGQGRRAGLGPTREAGVACAPEAGGSRSIRVSSCADPADEGGAAIVIQSELDGVVACDYALDGGPWLRLPTEDPRGVAMIAHGGQLEIALPPEVAPESAVAARCHAVDAEVWSALEPHWRAEFSPDEAHDVMKAFADVSGGVFVELVTE